MENVVIEVAMTWHAMTELAMTELAMTELAVRESHQAIAQGREVVALPPSRVDDFLGEGGQLRGPGLHKLGADVGVPSVQHGARRSAPPLVRLRSLYSSPRSKGFDVERSMAPGAAYREMG